MSRRSAADLQSGGKRLTLARHAKSSFRFGDLEDFRRPLNRRGLRDCVKIPPLVAKQLPRPDLVLCSDAVRAVQTCQALADALGIFEDRILLDNELYLGSHRALLKRISLVQPDARHVMVVGHNPGLSELCNYLLPAAVSELPTMAVASLRLEIRSWSDLARGRGSLEQLMLPRTMLKDLVQ